MAVSELEKSEKQKSFNFSPGRLPLFALKKKIRKTQIQKYKDKELVRPNYRADNSRWPDRKEHRISRPAESEARSGTSGKKLVFPGFLKEMEKNTLIQFKSLTKIDLKLNFQSNGRLRIWKKCKTKKLNFSPGRLPLLALNKKVSRNTKINKAEW